MAKSLDQVLSGFMNISGVSAVAVVGRDGFVIQSTATANVDMDALGAMVATAIGTAESLGREFGIGDLEQYLLEFKQGKIIMAAAKNDILAIKTDTTAVIGAIRYAVRKNIDEVIAAL